MGKGSEGSEWRGRGRTKREEPRLNGKEGGVELGLIENSGVVTSLTSVMGLSGGRVC